MRPMTAHDYARIRAIAVLKGITRNEADQTLRLKKSMVDSFVNRVVENLNLDVAPRDHDAILTGLGLTELGDMLVFSEEQFAAFARTLVDKERH